LRNGHPVAGNPVFGIAIVGSQAIGFWRLSPLRRCRPDGVDMMLRVGRA